MFKTVADYIKRAELCKKTFARRSLCDKFFSAESKNYLVEIFGVGHDNGRRCIKTCAADFLRIERQQNLPAFNRIARRNFWFESLADKFASVQADVNQKFDAAKRFQADNSRRSKKFYRAVEGRAAPLEKILSFTFASSIAVPFSGLSINNFSMLNISYLFKIILPALLNFHLPPLNSNIAARSTRILE